MINVDDHICLRSRAGVWHVLQAVNLGREAKPLIQGLHRSVSLSHETPGQQTRTEW